MMPIYNKVEARSEEWFRMRLGIPTASEFHKIVTPGGKISKQCTGYAHVLLAEAMLGHPLDDVQTQYMLRGKELEDKAIEAYELVTGLETQPGGFVTTDDGRYGCSPDRLVGDVGDLEIKCPAAHTHVGYLLSRDLDGEKQPQVQGRLLITGREWCDLMSYHPELPPVIVRVTRDEEYIAMLRTALDTFCSTLLELRLKLEREYGPFPDPMTHGKPVAALEDALGVSDADIEVMIAAEDARKIEALVNQIRSKEYF